MESRGQEHAYLNSQLFTFHSPLIEIYETKFVFINFIFHTCMFCKRRGAIAEQDFKASEQGFGR